MKKLRFFGLLVTVVLLAFGLALGCSNGSMDEETPSEDFRTSTYEGTANGQKVVITFSNGTLAKARAANDPQSGDNYLITVAGTESSRGTITLRPNGVIEFNPTTGDKFQGVLNSGVLSVANIPVAGGSPISVEATIPSTGQTPGGGGGGGGSGGGGGGGGGSGGGAIGGGGDQVSVSPSPEAQLITYTVAQTGGEGGNTATTAITLTFSGPVSGLAMKDISITNGTGTIELEDTFTISAANVLTINRKAGTPIRQGYISVSIAKGGIDPDVRKLNVFSAVGAEYDASPNEVNATFGLFQADGTSAGVYFTSDTTVLKVTFGGSGPAGFTLDNIGWNANLNNAATVDGVSTAGLKAEIELSNLQKTNATVYTAVVNVKKQGPVQFFLIGDDFCPAPDVGNTLVKATINEPMKYTVYRMDGTGGKSNAETTKQLKFVFEYDPNVIAANCLNTDNSEFLINPVGSAVWATDTTPTLDGTGRERILTTSNDFTVRQGTLGVTIARAGISNKPQEIEVYRKPLSKFTVTALSTLDITTHLLVKFDTDTEISATTNPAAGFGTGTFANTYFTVVSTNNEVLATTSAITNAPSPYVEVPATTATIADGTNQYLIPLTRPIRLQDRGWATVSLTAAGKTALPGVADSAIVQLVHGGYVGVEITGKTTAANAGTITFVFAKPLVTNLLAGGAVGADLPVPALSVVTSGSLAVVAPDIIVSLGNLTKVSTTEFTIGAASAGSNLGAAARDFTDLTATFLNPTTAPASPSAANYTNYFIDPAPKKFTYSDILVP